MRQCWVPHRSEGGCLCLAPRARTVHVCVDFTPGQTHGTRLEYGHVTVVVWLEPRVVDRAQYNQSFSVSVAVLNFRICVCNCHWFVTGSITTICHCGTVSVGHHVRGINCTLQSVENKNTGLPHRGSGLQCHCCTSSPEVLNSEG